MTKFKWQCCRHIENSQLTCCANQLTGFYVRARLAFNVLTRNVAQKEIGICRNFLVFLFYVFVLKCSTK